MIRAKFRVNRVVSNEWSNHKTGESEKYQEVVEMAPVYSPNPADENHAFWKASPSGSLVMYVDNPGAWGQFVVGQEYYLDFTLVPA